MPTRTGGRPGSPVIGHMAADRLDVEVERRKVLVFAGAAETGDRALDDARIDLVQRLIVDLQAFEHAGAEIVEHDVGDFDQIVEELRVRSRDLRLMTTLCLLRLKVRNSPLRPL